MYYIGNRFSTEPNFFQANSSMYFIGNMCDGSLIFLIGCQSNSSICFAPQGSVASKETFLTRKRHCCKKNIEVVEMK